MNKVTENQFDNSCDVADPFVGKDDDLVFVVMDGQEAGKMAIESRYGMVAFADNMGDLKTEITHKVQEYFHGKFQGEVCVRRFVDEIITL